ncbi:3-phosphoshikimate 1-carboxyvinyltransferase [Archaeoglobus neptunius]|uniref:3-phosphoshikimate 1-carboxyvinyltransferase n=1 Tax=Archaeoglobus neptunius TaxID=2798580 RepID=UPI001925E1F3|nr:3-phosphoshikimate 1-carboxyvinyltransferase [Archaeoglobus neptunius]
MEIVVRKSEIEGSVKPPSSKSYTHRAFISASLSPKARIINPLISEDTIATLNGCRKLGAFAWRRKGWIVEGVEDINSSGYFNFQNSGTTLRIFTGILSLSTSPRFNVLDGDRSLRKRPNRELCLALRKLGAEIRGDAEFKAPVKVKGILKGGEVEIEAASSQFVSALLFSLPMAKGDSVLRIKRAKSTPYINITLDVLGMSGIEVEREGADYHIPGEQRYRLKSYTVPADFSSASYLIAAGVMAGKIKILNIFDSEQGDKKIVEICRQMGGDVEWNKDEGVIVARKSDLEGVEVDASDIPDLVPTISILAAVARGETRIYNAEHLRIKEIDRIEGISRNLRALGVEVTTFRDGLVIRGGRREFKGTVDSFGDHRMALAFSLLGLLGEVRCRNAEAVSVSYPGFFDVLRSLGAKVERVN